MVIKFPDKSKALKGLYCLAPFETAMIDEWGKVYICGCDAWLPTPVGNINDEPIDVILNNALSKQIRSSIIDHSYTFCNEKSCKLIKNNELLSKSQLGKEYADIDNWKHKTSSDSLKRIFFAGDRTCNLSCPSCRTHVIKYHPSVGRDQTSKRDQLVDRFIKNLFSSPNSKLEEIVMSTSGELFASEVLLQVLEQANLENFPRCKLHIQTNGLLMKDRWDRLGQWKDRVGTVNLTADACDKEVYEKLRRGGRYDVLLENLQWFKEKKTNDNINFIMKMVVQRDNIHQIEEFYEFGKRYGANEVHYCRITDWKVMAPETFANVDILSDRHPDFEKANGILDAFKSKGYQDAKFIG
jgi:MoaA/NifB/PqqE/SkfB family radical SAM enzyme